MSTDERIGAFVIRRTEQRDTALTMPHLVESIIDDEPVTRCGRRLRARAGTYFHYLSSSARRLCAGCD